MDIKLDEGIINTVDIKSSSNQAKSDWVPIDEILHPVLEELLQGLPENSVQRLFSKYFNYKVWHKACDNMGLNDGIAVNDRINMLTPYCLRHSFATNMLKSGDYKEYRDLILGHSLRGMDVYYIAPDEKTLVEAMAKYTKWVDQKLETASVNVTHSVTQSR